MPVPVITCSREPPSLPPSLTSAHAIQAFHFSSFGRLVSCLVALSNTEYNLPFPLLVVLDASAAAGSPFDALSFEQLSQLLSMQFAHLNLLVVGSASFVRPHAARLVDEVVYDHHLFLKNQYKRAQAWIGLNTFQNDLTVTVFGGHNSPPAGPASIDADRANGTRSRAGADEASRLFSSLSAVEPAFSESSYPMLPVHIMSMNKNLAQLLNCSHHKSCFGQLNADNASSSLYSRAYSQYTDHILSNVDLFSLLNLSDDRKFYIKEFLIESWNFPAHTLSYDELVYVCFLIFKRAFRLFDASSPLIPSDSRLLLILFKVRELYNGGNDFHNFRHAIDVVQAIFCYLLKLSLLDKDAIISKKIIVHEHRRNKKRHLSSAQEKINAALVDVVEHLVNINEQTIDNNDDLSKESEELDPLTEYLVYLKCPNLYFNQLKTYQLVLDEQFPRAPVDESGIVVTTEHGKFRQKDKSKLLKPMEVLSLFIAALGHDSGHPGLTNAFINSNDSPLSTIYGEESVLENYHFIIFNGLLQRLWPELFDKNIVNQVSEGAPSVNVKKIIQRSILATDMEKHFLFIDQIKNKERDGIDNNKNKNELPIIELSPEFLCQLLLKCADISNITRPLKLSANWGLILGKELQGINALTKIFEFNKRYKSASDSERAVLLQNEDFIKHVKLYELEDTQELQALTEFFTAQTNAELPPRDQTTSKDIAEKIETGEQHYTLKTLLEKNPTLCLSQIFFIEKISYKLFEKISQILPWLSYTFIILNKNLKFWKLLKEKHNI